MMTSNWKSDPRLQSMDPRKIQLLEEFAGQIAKTDKNNLLTGILALNQKAAAQGLHFDDQETGLIVSVLTCAMSPGEKKKVETLRLLSKKLAGRR